MKLPSVDVKLVSTFGAPRGLCSEAASWVEENLLVHRWVNHNDPVAHLPPKQFMGYGYDHAGLIHFVDGDGVLHVDPGPWRRLREQFDGALEDLADPLGDHSLEAYREILLPEEEEYRATLLLQVLGSPEADPFWSWRGRIKDDSVGVHVGLARHFPGVFFFFEGTKTFRQVYHDFNLVQVPWMEGAGPGKVASGFLAGTLKFEASGLAEEALSRLLAEGFDPEAEAIPAYVGGHSLGAAQGLIWAMRSRFFVGG